MAIDQVCKMQVEKSSAAGTSEYMGETYYFCCPGCKVDFDKDPEKYLNPDADHQSHNQHQH